VDDPLTVGTENLVGEKGVSALDQLHVATELDNSWRSSTPFFECDDLPSSPSADLAGGPASEDGHVAVRRHSPEVRLFDTPEMQEYWSDGSVLSYFHLDVFAGV